MTEANSTNKTDRKTVARVFGEHLLKFLPVVAFFVFAFVAYKAWIWWSRKAVYKLALFWQTQIGVEGPPHVTMADLGQAGDIFGGVNALFAAFAFVGVAFAAYYQRRTFLQQREDAVLAQNALTLSNVANQAQIALSRQEQFENLFFRVLAEAQRQLDGLKLKPDEEDGEAEKNQIEADMIRLTKSTHALVETTLTNLYGLQLAGIYRTDLKERVGQVREKADQFYAELYVLNRLVLAPLFRTLYLLFNTISRSHLNYEQQCDYAKIARASLNENIVRLLMLNGLSKPGLEFKPLIEKYGLLKHIEADPYSQQKILNLAKRLYDAAAFEGFSYRRCCYDAKTGNLLKTSVREDNLEQRDHQLWLEENSLGQFAEDDS